MSIACGVFLSHFLSLNKKNIFIAELSKLNLISQTLSQLTETGEVGSEVIPEVRYADASFIVDLSEHNKETRPGMSYDEWWKRLTRDLKFSLGGVEALKKDIHGLVEPFLRAVGRHSTPWEKVHPFDVFWVVNKLLEENY